MRTIALTVDSIAPDILSNFHHSQRITREWVRRNNRWEIIDVSVLRAGAVQTGMLGASTDALDRFCENTALYSCNADRFRRIVGRVEARCVPPERIAQKCERILGKKHPAYVYAINRNPLLLLLNALPKRMQLHPPFYHEDQPYHFQQYM